MSNILSYMSDLGPKNSDLEKINDLAIAASKFLKDKGGKLLPLVHIKGKGHGYFWSVSSNKLVLVPRRAEFYMLPWKKDEKGRYYLFLPCFLTNGTVICVYPDEIEYLGLN